MTIGENAKIALFVGVTGHRDILDADIPEIRTRVASELKRIESAAKGVRLILLSALAGGGDQIVAEEALEQSWEVFAVFPMPFSDYLADFTTDQQRAALIKLKERCAAIHEIPWANTQDPDISDPRDQQYRNQSVFIARQSQAVIALWDGSPAQAKGACGTAYVATLCREGSLPPIEGEVLAAPEPTPLIHIPVRRKNTPEPTQVLPPMPDKPTDLRIAKDFSAYANAVVKIRKSSPEKIEQSADWLISKEDMNSLDSQTRTLIEHYCFTDALALDRQNKRNLAVKIASIATVFGAFAQATNGILAQSSWMIAYGAALALAYGLYVVLFQLPFFRFEDRYLEYRALAEAIRVQLFWRIAGISAVAAEHYLQLVKTEVGWVREALRSTSLSVSMTSTPTLPDYKLVKEFWIDDQSNYFVGKNLQKNEGEADKCKKRNRAFDLATYASLAFGAILVSIAGAGTVYPTPPWIKQAASAYSASFFLMAGVIKGYVSSMGYAEQAISYEKMGAMFRSVQALFEHGKSVREEHLLALGKQALAENADWLMLHRKNAFNVQAPN